MDNPESYGLEKQGEQKPVSNTLKEAFDKSKTDYSLEESEKASEYSESIIPTSVTYGESEEEYMLHSIIEAAFIAGQNFKQQPTWGEEDKKMIKCCEIALEFFEKLGKNTQGFPHENYFELDEKIYPSEVKHWLKFVSTQTKQEWSEEDKGNLLDVKCIIDEVWHNQYVREEIDHSGEELESLWHWLNNLWERVAYPKNTWKPSDEQMEALEWQIKNTSGDSWQYSKSKELLEQLKKIREE